MTKTVFYCPLKAPDENIASGVPRIGAYFIRALELAGYPVVCPKLPSSYEPIGDAASQEVLSEVSAAAAKALIAEMRQQNQRPRAWFTYHCYYKAPDLIGPLIAREFGCPYFIAEGSYARKRIGGPWGPHVSRAEAALAAADILLSTTERDRAGLEMVPHRSGKVIPFPPFIDPIPFLSAKRHVTKGRIRILAAGSMRDARKLQSYKRLFEGLANIPIMDFELTIAGDGPKREVVESYAQELRNAGARIVFLGQLRPMVMPDFFARGDVFAWPGIGEAYGLTYLEAQAAGLPVVAEDHGGVTACVRDGVSGILTDPRTPRAFGDALLRMIADTHQRMELGRLAQNWVIQERSLAASAYRLRDLLAGLNT
jgi:glycosyltransferase involved in cell wall biosynthesis